MGRRVGCLAGDQVLPLNTKRTSLVGRGWGWWEVWRRFFAGGCKVTQWVEVCVGCQMSGSFYLASLYTPGSSWKPACLYLQLFSEPPLTILKTLSSSEWRGRDYIHYYILKPIFSSGFLSLDLPRSPNNLKKCGAECLF